MQQHGRFGTERRDQSDSPRKLIADSGGNEFRGVGITVAFIQDLKARALSDHFES